jgi:hypothetical protein
VRFTINGKYIAAMRVSDDQDDGDWYTTISDDVEQCLPFGDYASRRTSQDMATRFRW